MRGRQYFRGSAPFQMRFFIHSSVNSFNKVLPNFFDEVIFLDLNYSGQLIQEIAGCKLGWKQTPDRKCAGRSSRVLDFISRFMFPITVQLLGSSMATNRSRTSSSKAVLTSRNTQESLVLTQAT